MKAADLPDATVVSAIASLQGSTVTPDVLEALWPALPPKLIRAKLRKLIRRGSIEGCACGCRGDFRVAQ